MFLFNRSTSRGGRMLLPTVPVPLGTSTIPLLRGGMGRTLPGGLTATSSLRCCSSTHTPPPTGTYHLEEEGVEEVMADVPRSEVEVGQDDCGTPDSTSTAESDPTMPTSTIQAEVGQEEGGDAPTGATTTTTATTASTTTMEWTAQHVVNRVLQLKREHQDKAYQDQSRTAKRFIYHLPTPDDSTASWLDDASAVAVVVGCAYFKLPMDSHLALQKVLTRCVTRYQHFTPQRLVHLFCSFIQISEFQSEISLPIGAGGGELEKVHLKAFAVTQVLPQLFSGTSPSTAATTASTQTTTTPTTTFLATLSSLDLAVLLHTLLKLYPKPGRSETSADSSAGSSTATATGAAPATATPTDTSSSAAPSPPLSSSHRKGGVRRVQQLVLAAAKDKVRSTESLVLLDQCLTFFGAAMRWRDAEAARAMLAYIDDTSSQNGWGRMRSHQLVSLAQSLSRWPDAFYQQKVQPSSSPNPPLEAGDTAEVDTSVEPKQQQEEGDVVMSIGGDDEESALLGEVVARIVSRAIALASKFSAKDAVLLLYAAGKLVRALPGSRLDGISEDHDLHDSIEVKLIQFQAAVYHNVARRLHTLTPQEVVQLLHGLEGITWDSSTVPPHWAQLIVDHLELFSTTGGSKKSTFHTSKVPANTVKYSHYELAVVLGTLARLDALPTHTLTALEPVVLSMLDGFSFTELSHLAFAFSSVPRHRGVFRQLMAKLHVQAATTLQRSIQPQQQQQQQILFSSSSSSSGGAAAKGRKASGSGGVVHQTDLLRLGCSMLRYSGSVDTVTARYFKQFVQAASVVVQVHPSTATMLLCSCPGKDLPGDVLTLLSQHCSSRMGALSPAAALRLTRWIASGLADGTDADALLTPLREKMTKQLGIAHQPEKGNDRLRPSLVLLGYELLGPEPFTKEVAMTKGEEGGGVVLGVDGQGGGGGGGDSHSQTHVPAVISRAAGIAFPVTIRLLETFWFKWDATNLIAVLSTQAPALAAQATRHDVLRLLNLFVYFAAAVAEDPEEIKGVVAQLSALSPALTEALYGRENPTFVSEDDVDDAFGREVLPLDAVLLCLREAGGTAVDGFVLDLLRRMIPSFLRRVHDPNEAAEVFSMYAPPQHHHHRMRLHHYC